MTLSARTDRDVLTNHAYASDDKLNIRYETHEKYTVPRFDFKAWVLDAIDWHGNEIVLDLGAGPGSYFAGTKAYIPWGQHIAGDLSFGMVQRQQANTAAKGSGLANIDAQTLPFPDNTFDVILANHMLYHVPNIDSAIAEIKRVLKPEGMLLAATNSNNNMPELRNLQRRALLVLTNFDYASDSLDLPGQIEFSLENASSILGRHFYAVARHDMPSSLIFPEVEPVMRYMESTRDLREPNLPDGIRWADYMNVMEGQVQRLFEHSGKITVKKLSGVIVATERGGFASQFIAMLGG